MQLSAGYLLDRYRTRFILSSVILIMTLGNWLASIAHDGVLFNIANFLEGVGWSFDFISVSVLISQWFSARMFPILTGLVQTLAQHLSTIFYFRDSSTFETIPRSKEVDKGFHEHSYCYIEDGVLIVENGKVQAVGQYTKMSKELTDIKVIDYKGRLITPGFIDIHNHATQRAIVAAYGEKLLEWLNNYVFPAESNYKDDEHARRGLNFFIDLLLRNGNATAVTHGSLFYEANNIFLKSCKKEICAIL